MTQRLVQGFGIVIGWAIAIIALLATVLAWGPHSCQIKFPTVIGCAIGQYPTLVGGMVAAGTALFAGWLAWSAVQVQIAAEERRAAADRIEVEKLLQADLNYLAEGLRSIWKILLAIDEDRIPADVGRTTAVDGVIYGINKVANDAQLNTLRKMVTVLGWERRREYEELLDRLEQLGRHRDPDNFDVLDALDEVREVGEYLIALRPDTAEYFEGLWRRTPKGMSLGDIITAEAGLTDILDDDEPANSS